MLWRPFHESDGTWFWWGAKGPVVAKELYLLMYDYYTNRHALNNLLWVWNCRLPEGYPGDDFVDVVSVDIYLPDAAMLAESHIPWAYFMTWSKEFCIGETHNTKQQFRSVYQSDNVITMEAE